MVGFNGVRRVQFVSRAPAQGDIIPIFTQRRIAQSRGMCSTATGALCIHLSPRGYFLFIRNKELEQSSSTGQQLCHNNALALFIDLNCVCVFYDFFLFFLIARHSICCPGKRPPIGHLRDTPVLQPQNWSKLQLLSVALD